MKVPFAIEKETKNAVRYAETSPEGTEIIGSLYVKKSGLRALGHEGDGWPATLSVDVTIPA
jgi:hypothetical protein